LSTRDTSSLMWQSASKPMTGVHSCPNDICQNVFCGQQLDWSPETVSRIVHVPQPNKSCTDI
jgi:hypothetical protein